MSYSAPKGIRRTFSMCFKNGTMKLLTLFGMTVLIASSVLGETPIYRDPSKPSEMRIDDLLGRMTLKEKVGQMNIPTCYSTEIGWGLGSERPYLWDDPNKENRDIQLQGCLKWAEGTHNDVFGPGGGFFTLA